MLRLAKINNSHESGFTLIELAIVLVIIGVLAGAFISTLGSRIDTTRRAEAAKEMEIIKQALYGYAMSQADGSLHLPCPDCRNVGCVTYPNKPNDGIEDKTIVAGVNQCDVGVAVGNIPWVTLGVGLGDPWGNRYSYWVSTVVDDNSPNPGFDLTQFAPAQMATINTRIKDATKVVTDKAVAIIMSQGKNGYGIISAQNIPTGAIPAANLDEKENLNFDLFFHARPATDVGASTAGGEFDDMLIWISEYELKAKMVEAGKLP